MAGSNPFDEWTSIVASGTAADHKTIAQSTAAIATTLTIAGWYKISGAKDFWIKGPTATSSTVTTSTGEHWWAKDTAIYKAEAGDKIVTLGAAAATTIYVSRIKGY